MSADIRVVVEAESGSCDRHTYDEQTLERLRTVRLSAPHPFPYGFVLGTTGDDGDAIDCYIITERELAAGSVVPCRAVALLEQLEDGQADHKVLAAIVGERPVVDDALRDRLRAFIDQVFASLPDARVEVGRLLGPEAAARLLLRATSEAESL